jgi:hypothetical protein
MPSSGAFSSLFPPILDLQTRDPIATRDAAEAAGTAGPSFAVPRLPPDPEPFVLRDIDGDGRDGARLLAALEGEGEGESEAEDDNVEEDDRKDWKTRRRERIEPIDDVWKRAWEPAPTPAFEVRLRFSRYT